MPKRTRDHRSVLLEDLSNNPLLAANYLTAALEESDKMFLRALRDVAEANRLARVAEEAGLSRETLYRTLSEEGNPRFSSLSSIFRVLGLKIRVEVQERSAAGALTPLGQISAASQKTVQEQEPAQSDLIAKLMGTNYQRKPKDIFSYAH